jgi:hypothetical protein
MGDIYQVPASGGTPIPVIKKSKDYFCAYPQFLSDGKHFLYFVGSSDYIHAGIYWASLNGKEDRLVLSEKTRALYASRFLLYLREGALMAQAFDPEGGQLEGDPHPVAERVADNGFFRGIFDLSENGVLVYQAVGAEKQLSWLDRTAWKSST